MHTLGKLGGATEHTNNEDRQVCCTSAFLEHTAGRDMRLGEGKCSGWAHEVLGGCMPASLSSWRSSGFGWASLMKLGTSRAARNGRSMSHANVRAEAALWSTAMTATSALKASAATLACTCLGAEAGKEDSTSSRPIDLHARAEVSREVRCLLRSLYAKQRSTNALQRDAKGLTRLQNQVG